MSRSIHEEGRWVDTCALVKNEHADISALSPRHLKTFVDLLLQVDSMNEVELNISNLATTAGRHTSRTQILDDLKYLEENFFIKIRDKTVLVSPVYAIGNWKFLSAIQTRWRNA